MFGFDWNGDRSLRLGGLYGTLLCISLTVVWWFYRTVAWKRRQVASSTPTAAEDKTVRFQSTKRPTSSSFQRPSATSSFWHRNSQRSMDDGNNKSRRIRLYSDPGTHRIDHQADMELLERTQQQRSTTRTTNTTTSRSINPTTDSTASASASSSNHPTTPSITAASATSLAYATWVPPPTWTETRRRTFRSAHSFARTLTIHLDSGRLECDGESSNDGCEDVWVCPTERVEAGVLRIYRHSSNVEPTEHSFRSAQAAAQLQWDWIAVQTVGRSLYHLYRVLALVHQGSTSTSCEPVLHDATTLAAVDLTPTVAWDDAMRCLGMYFPSIRFRLEALYALRDHAEEPQQKRVLLRLVDFFRLFVPQLPSTALPERNCARIRMERLLQTRKRVAKAAVLVQTYVQARTIVHRGWLPASPADTARRRLAYDTNWDNAQHDGTVVLAAAGQPPEYYEATVSRDIHIVSCTAPASKCAAVGYQAYSLVGMQTFPWPDGDDTIRDPLLAFPSLQSLVRQHPQHHFWIQSIYARRTVCVQVFVRSLAPSVDRRLDATLERYAASGKEGRDAQLILHVQLGLALDGLSWIGSLLLLFLTTVLTRFSPTASKDRIVSRSAQEPTSDNIAGRTSLPGIQLSTVSETYHFGNANTNYVACASVWGRNNELVSQLLLTYLESGVFALLADATLVLADAPQSAMCSIRIVQPSSMSSQKQQRPRIAGVFWDLVVFLVADPLRRWCGSKTQQAAPITTDQQERRQSNLVPQPSLLDSSSIDDEENDYLLTKIPLTQSVYIEQAVTKLMDMMHSLEQRSDVADGFFRAFTRHDVLRHFTAEQCNLRRTLVRIVASAKWRHATFPIDLRTCRVELQNRQFVQNGFDRKGRPIFCFRTTLLGPWRKNEEAVINAVLHTFDESIQRLSRLQPFLQCVVIVILGRSAKAGRSSRRSAKEDKGDTMEDGALLTSSSLPDEVLYEQATFDSTMSCDALPTVDYYAPTKDMVVPADRNIQPACITWDNCSPRIPDDEIPKNHTNQRLVVKLIDILLTHYPERLHRAFVVIGHGNGYLRSKLEAKLALPSLVASPTTRDKIQLLSRLSDLNHYFDFFGCRDVAEADGAEEAAPTTRNDMEEDDDDDDDNSESLA